MSIFGGSGNLKYPIPAPLSVKVDSDIAGKPSLAILPSDKHLKLLWNIILIF